MTLDHAADGKFQKLRARIDCKRKRGVQAARFCQRGANRRGDPRPRRYGSLRNAIARGSEINELRRRKNRRAGKHDCCHIRAVAGKRVHDAMRRLRGTCDSLGNGTTHERRGVTGKQGESMSCMLLLRPCQSAIEIGLAELRRSSG
jgi:hypothetical protein